MRRRPRLLPLVLAALAVAALGAIACIDPAPRLVWNASASAPVGLYRVDNGLPGRGDFVLVALPPALRRLAAARFYLPDGVPLVKRIAALGGDRVCAIDDRIFVNGQIRAERLMNDTRGRPLPRWQGCLVLDDDELLLLMEGVQDSFDGRYFGPVRRHQVVARLAPLWTR